MKTTTTGSHSALRHVALRPTAQGAPWSVAITAGGLWALFACAACSSDETSLTQLPVIEPAPFVPPKVTLDEPAPVKPTAAPPAPSVVAKPELPVTAPDSSGPPVLRNPVLLDDLVLGRQVLALLGGDGAATEGRCSTCHSITRPTLSLWAHLTRAFSSACLSDTSLDSQDQVDQSYRCLLRHELKKLYGPLEVIDLEKFPEAQPSKERLSPRSAGIYAAASHLPWFSYLLGNTSEPQKSDTFARERFIAQVGMPRAGEPLTQEEFDQLAEWFERDLPGLLELVPEDPGEPCVPGLAPELARELDELANTGWRAKNLETPLLMFGCAPGETGSKCLGSLPNASDNPTSAGWTASMPNSTIRVLYDNTQNGPTVFWSRSSADGRYIASGAGGGEPLGGQFIDLAGGRRMVGDFFYDPTFFPDNSSLLVQGEGTLLCKQSVLDGRFETITAEREGCTGFSEQGISLYQQLATSLDGGDYWAVTGLFESDEPGFEQLHTPFAPFSADTTLDFTPVINRGNSFELGEPISLPAPFQGDPALSPSGKLLVTRTKGAEVFDPSFGPFITATQSGYTFYRVNTTRNEGTRSVSLERAGQLCLQGGKATFSFDERWLVIYRYITPADAVELGFDNAQDPTFAEYAERGGANIYLFDLKSGKTTRITNMAPGQYALFPHFRSDGWIYFVVRDSGRTEPAQTELFVASDAALRLEEAEVRP